LIPYLSTFHEPFVLISTGTWCISLNPFNHTSLTDEELKKDCLCYLSYEGNPVKASRLFAGHEHEQEILRLAAHFNKVSDCYKTVEYNDAIVNQVGKGAAQQYFSETDLHQFKTYEEAYHHLMWGIVRQQVTSTRLILKDVSVRKIFVDGGFAKNKVYMTMLASAFHGVDVYAATISQASALGAGLAIHNNWSHEPLPDNMIELKRFTKM